MGISGTHEARRPTTPKATKKHALRTHTDEAGEKDGDGGPWDGGVSGSCLVYVNTLSIACNRRTRRFSFVF